MANKKTEITAGIITGIVAAGITAYVLIKKSMCNTIEIGFHNLNTDEHTVTLAELKAKRDGKEG